MVYNNFYIIIIVIYSYINKKIIISMGDIGMKKGKQPPAEPNAGNGREAAADVAYNLAMCFKKMRWNVISFFPNTSCRAEDAPDSPPEDD